MAALTPDVWLNVALYSNPRAVFNVEQLNKSTRSAFKEAGSGNTALQRSWYHRYQLIVWDKEHLPKSISSLAPGQLPTLNRQEKQKDWRFTFKQEYMLELSRMMKTPTTSTATGPGTSVGNFPKFASPTSAGVSQNVISSPNGVRRTFIGDGDNRTMVENTNHTCDSGSNDGGSSGGGSPNQGEPPKVEEGVAYAGDVHFTKNGAKGPNALGSPVSRGEGDGWKAESRKAYKSQRSKPKEKTMKGGQNYWASYDELTQFDDE